MTPEIKDYATWEEAQRWLAKHGWGLGLIEEQKILWDAANPPPIVELEVTHKPVVRTAVKSVAKATE
jgi:hypothetical protein